MYHTSDTICATATAPGIGGIAIIRVSGKEARSIVSSLYSSPSGQKNLMEIPARQATFGYIYSGSEVLDEVVVTPFFAPASFTGDDVVEIACHGSIYIRGELIRLLLEAGCRMAEPGEFTYRAYLNGKMDLSRAEAVADIISAESKAQHSMALNQLRGNYSQEFDNLRERLLEFAALMELELDFPEEDVEFADRSQLLLLAEEVSTKISRLTESYRLGNAIRKGIPTAIVGVTNAGKSTLLNQLVGEERAIVSDIHGTTRDTVEDVVNVDGLLFRFIDTAGLRETTDTIESIGIQRSYTKMQEASVVLLVLDGTRLGEDSEQTDLLRSLWEQDVTQPKIILINKADLLTETDQTNILQKVRGMLGDETPILFISAERGEAIDQLRAELVRVMSLPTREEGDLIVSNARHHDLLLKANESLSRLVDGMTSGIPTDLLTPDLRLCISYIGQITGREVTREETLHHIFRHFCIGK